MPSTSSRLRTLAAAAFLLAAATAPALAGDLEKGLELKAAGKFDAALPHLEKAVEADPKKADAALALSEVLAGLGKYERAAKVVADAIEANPEDVRLPLARGRAFMLEAARLDSQRADANMILSYVADADRWIKMVLAKDPKNSDARVLKTKVSMFQGLDSEKVVAELQQIAADDPKSFDARWEIAQVYWRRATANNKDKNLWVAAEKHFRDAYAVDPKSGAALLHATWAKAWQAIKGSTPELIKDYGECAKLLPEDPRPLVGIWKLRNAKDMAPTARAAFESAAAASAKAKAFVSLMDAEAALAADKGDAAVKAYVAAAEGYGDGAENDAYLAVYKGVIQSSLDQDQREKIAEAAWKRWPKRSEIPNDFALWNRDQSHDYKTSLKWYLRAAEAAPKSPRVLNDTGLIYHYHMKDNAKGEGWYRKAIDAAEEQGIEPSDDRANEGMGLRDALNNLALVLTQEKRWKELRELAEKHVPEGFPNREKWLKAGD